MRLIVGGAAAKEDHGPVITDRTDWRVECGFNLCMKLKRGRVAGVCAERCTCGVAAVLL